VGGAPASREARFRGAPRQAASLRALGGESPIERTQERPTHHGRSGSEGLYLVTVIVVPKKAEPSRTFNPLHFEDLDPHRFEDLVRQLIHDFRSWNQIEALGRSGADEGIDIRALEAVHDPQAEPTDDIDEVADIDLRYWYMQCKREKRIGPKRAETIAEELLQGGEVPYGVVLAAPADFSKRTRDTFRQVLFAAGVEEVHIWGKAELEDLLYRPTNDHLLFAYFGISLQIKRRATTTLFRRRLTMKRQLVKTLGGPDDGRVFKHVLIRDPDEDRYPHSDAIEEFSENPAWLTAEFEGWQDPDYLPVVFENYHAWLSADKKSYDFIHDCNSAGWQANRWWSRRQDESEFCKRLRNYANWGMPEENRARLQTIGWIHLDDIVLVDDIGDTVFEPPHLLVNRTPRYGFFRHVRSFVEDGNQLLPADELRRKKLFPDPIPDASPPENPGERW